MPHAPRVRVFLLFGGRSAEHDVSTVSALHVLRALDRSAYDVTPIGITREGRWLDLSSAVAALDPSSVQALPSPDAVDVADAADAVGPAGLPVIAHAADQGPVVVLPLLHGPMGEDGTVQGMLELAGVPYVGAGVLASAVCMDKPTAKRVLEAEGLPVVPWVSARRHRAGDGLVARVESVLGYPVFVKPANLGSSVAVSRARDADELRTAVRTALEYDEYVLVEEAIRGREIEVAVLGNEDPVASVPGEIRPSHEFYDYSDKYVESGAGLVVPAELSPSQAKEVCKLAVQAYEALRVDGMGRVDFFFEEGGRGFLVNEVNTIPGFTPISMYPRLWEASGVAFPELVQRLIELALARHATRSGFSTRPGD